MALEPLDLAYQIARVLADPPRRWADAFGTPALQGLRREVPPMEQGRFAQDRVLDVDDPGIGFGFTRGGATAATRLADPCISLVIHRRPTPRLLLRPADCRTARSARML